MRYLWNHERISYGRAVTVANPDGSERQVTPVRYDGKPVGHVSRAEQRENGWGYRLAEDTDKPWTVGFETRADAADHLLSHRSPSAAWLV